MTEYSEVRTPEFLPRKRRLALGLDPGQAKDPCANCVVEYARVLSTKVRHGSGTPTRPRLSGCRSRRASAGV